ncbi:MAG: hypothetical protein AB1630_09920, partial [bacterium]
MKRFVLFLVFGFWLVRNGGATETVSGDVSGTWTEGNSPYLVEGDINVPLDKELYVERGVEVRFNNGRLFTISGTLNTYGSLNSPVVFTGYSQQKGYWRGIEVYGYANLNYTNILYGGYPHYAKASNLYVEGILTLNNCLIGSSSNYGIWINQGSITITNSTFTANTWPIYQSLNTS